MLELSDRDVQVDGELRQYVERVFQNARAQAAVVPIALTIKNTGSSGIRNLYVEMSIKALEGDVQVSDSDPARETGRFPFLWSAAGEASEIERKLEKFSGKGLTKEGNEWRFSFEWEALQPQRVRLIQPFTFLQVASVCKTDFSAKVYADSFANPIVLHAQLAVNVQPKLIQSDVIVAKAKELMEAATSATVVTSSIGSGWSTSIGRSWPTVMAERKPASKEETKAADNKKGRHRKDSDT